MQTSHSLGVAGLVMYSANPARLAAFYRDALGVPLEAVEHGGVGNHHEGMLGNTHVAIWDARKGHAAAALIPTFRVQRIAAADPVVQAAGAIVMHKPVDLGEGKRVAGYADPDGRPFRLIEII